jgi:hypothetical protein
VALTLGISVHDSIAATLNQSLSIQERLQLGERIYRQGILPTGEPTQAYIKGDLPVSGAAFTCVSCHLRSGFGSIEGGVYTPPTSGSILFQPLKTLFKGFEQSPKYYPLPPRRAAYNDVSLAAAIRYGVDSDGRALNEVMPRYMLEDDDISLLIQYLHSLSMQYSPGVSETNLSFATVISDDVSPEDRDAMLLPLENYVKAKNNQANAYKTPTGARSRLMAENMLGSKELATRTLSLSRWILKGPPETWRTQLEEYYRKEPVFALLGGITKGEWQPIHQFSEENQIPSLLPITEFPHISGSDWYSLYFSKGYYQEGETVARYLNSKVGAKMAGPVIQIVRASKAGLALSSGFQEVWRELGYPAPITITLNDGETVTKAMVQKMLFKVKPSAINLWTGEEALPALEFIATDKNKPDMVFVSSSYLGKSIWTLKEEIRELTYISYPYTFSQTVVTPTMGSKIIQNDSQKSLRLAELEIKDTTRKIASLSTSLTQILTMALMDMRGNYYRDNFFDVIGMIPDQNFPLFERLSFGPGQRYASKGCYIVQLEKGSKQEIVKKSDWVIH